MASKISGLTNNNIFGTLKKRRTTNDPNRSTKKTEAKALTIEGQACVDRNIEYTQIYEGKKTVKNLNVKDCFLNKLEFLSDPGRDIKAIQGLLSKKSKPRNIDYTNLPVYFINGHSANEFRIELKPPKDLPQEKIDELQNYSYDSQLKANYSINRVTDARNSRYPTRSDFFKTKADSTVFIIQAAPFGYDSLGCRAETNFKKYLSERYSDFRNLCLSSKFEEILARPEISPTSIFIPPGYSTINKTYQFWEHGGGTKERWGVYNMSRGHFTPADMSKASSRFFQENHYSESQIECEYPLGQTYMTQFPQMHPKSVGYTEGDSSNERKLRKIIEDAVKNHIDVPLSLIVETLGPGIYIDVGCSSIPLKIWDPEEKRYDNIPPELWKNLDNEEYEDSTGVQPIFNVIMNDLELYTYNLKHAWRNIVTSIESVRTVKSGKNNNNMSNENVAVLRNYSEMAYSNNAPLSIRTAQGNINRTINESMKEMYNRANKLNPTPVSNNVLGYLSPVAIASTGSIANRVRARRRKRGGKKTRKITRKTTRNNRRRKKKKSKRRTRNKKRRN